VFEAVGSFARRRQRDEDGSTSTPSAPAVPEPVVEAETVTP
jgi:hypothetical protein